MIKKYQCPYCESFDVRKNEKGELICFTCFNMFSSDAPVKTRSSQIPPDFPDALERRKIRRGFRSMNDEDSESEFLTNVIK